MFLYGELSAQVLNRFLVANLDDFFVFTHASARPMDRCGSSSHKGQRDPPSEPRSQQHVVLEAQLHDTKLTAAVGGQAQVPAEAEDILVSRVHAS